MVSLWILDLTYSTSKAKTCEDREFYGEREYVYVVGSPRDSRERTCMYARKSHGRVRVCRLVLQKY